MLIEFAALTGAIYLAFYICLSLSLRKLNLELDVIIKTCSAILAIAIANVLI